MNKHRKWLRAAVSAALCATLTLPSAFALFPAKVNTDALYLRATPGGEIIGTLTQDTRVAVINNSTSWFKVAVAGKEGYVSGSYLAGSPNGDFLLGNGRIKCDTYVNLREQPNTSANVLATIPNGTTVNARGVWSGWYKIVYDGKTGYIHPDYLTFGAAASSAVASTTTTTSASTVSYSSTSETRTKVLDYAAQFLGTPYVYGGSTPSGFDCSGFTSYVYANTVGSIPRVAQSQFNATQRVTMDELLPGDLVFFGSSASSISHVGIYVGDQIFIHSPHTGDVVKYDSLTGSYATRFQGGGRVITD